MTLPSVPPPDSGRARFERPWEGIAAEVRGWTRAQGLELRDVVVLLPFAQLLAPARDAFAAAGVWMPRIETTRTLRSSLGPAPAVPPGVPSLEAAADELGAMRLLAERRHAFTTRLDVAAAAPDLVVLAHGLARVAATRTPQERGSARERGRALLGPRAGAGADERLLARIAFEWAELASAALDEALWSLRPAGWVIVRVGGADVLAEALSASTAAPRLTIDLDAEAAATLDAGFIPSSPSLVACTGFEDEAQAAAAEVIAFVRDGVAPVALIAQDRTLTRRIRAVLERRGVALADETGWRLSTTRAAARLTALLDLGLGDGATDTLIDAMKSIATWRAGADFARGAEWLESTCRRRRLTRRSQLDAATLDGHAASALAALLRWLAPLEELAADGSHPLPAWLGAVAAMLRSAGAWEAMAADAAGRAVIEALGLDLDRGAGRVLRAVTIELDARSFRQWVDRALETSSFVPPAPAQPEVIVLPLERALLRPFAAVVFPGADDRQLGGPQTGWPWLGDSLAGELGLPTQAQRLASQWSATLQLLRVPRLVWLHRSREEGESLGPSRWIERIDVALARHGRAIERRADRRERLVVPAAPVARSEPVTVRLAALERLSATATEALRDCPYRFFALHRLRLAEDRELDDEVAPQDFGNWVHDVLLRFHATREASADAAAETARLREVAADVRSEQGFDEASFAPFEASFEALAPRYIAWLHDRDAEGWRWRAGEERHEVRPAELGGVVLQGVIDRIDAQGARLELIDYKTGSADALRWKLRNPFEDTQLAFYALLIGDEAAGEVSARYLALGKAQKLEEVEHKDVGRSAAALLRGLGDELGRIGAGAALLPLGEGPSCEHCAARGLCRRDHWWHRS